MRVLALNARVTLLICRSYPRVTAHSVRTSAQKISVFHFINILFPGVLSINDLILMILKFE